MSKENNLTDFLTDIADAIRYVEDSTDAINPQAFSDKIKSFKIESTSISLTSETTITDQDETTLLGKQQLLQKAINNTVIDNETVYKIAVQENEDTEGVIDTVFYTHEGDSGNYCYILSGGDNYLYKSELV